MGTVRERSYTITNSLCLPIICLSYCLLPPCFYKFRLPSYSRAQEQQFMSSAREGLLSSTESVDWSCTPLIWTPFLRPRTRTHPSWATTATPRTHQFKCP